MKKSWALGVLTLLFTCVLATRLYKIHSVPSVISHDEIYYTVQAKTIALTGSDPTGRWKPWSLTAADPLYAELPGLVMAPAFWLLPNNALLASKLPAALLGTLLTLILGGIAYLITKDRLSLVLTGVLAAVNPWLFQFSRMGFDSLLSLFFYFFGLLCMMLPNRRYRWLAAASFALGFFQYQGLKIVFVPFVLLSLVYVWIRDGYKLTDFGKKSVRAELLSLVVVGVCSLVVMGGYVVRTVLNPDTQRTQSDLIFSDRNTLTSLVDVDRQQALATPLQSVFSNKFTVLAAVFAKQYAASFNPTQLFVTGEPLRNPFSVWKWGMFYAIDVLLIAVGLFVVLSTRKYRAAAVLLVGIMLIAPLPSAINGKGIWVMFRSSLMVPALILLAGLGLQHCWRNWHKLATAAVVLIYLLSVVWFTHEYFGKYPVYGTQGKYFAERVLSSYIHRLSQDQKVIVLADEPKFVFESYLTFTNAIDQTTIAQVQRAFQQHEFVLGNVRVQNTCLTVADLQEGVTVIADSAIPVCDNQRETTEFQERRATATQIPSLLDSGAIYTVYNDTLCGNYALDRYSHVDSDVFAIESITNQQLCESFFTRE